MAEGVAQARIKVAGTEVKTDAMSYLQVDFDVDQPDMCIATVNNTAEYKFSEKTNQGDEVEVTIGSTTATPETLFKGEVVGLEPIFDVGGETKVIIRAFNKLHRLTRARKSKTFEKKTDADLAKAIAGDYGLTPKITGDINIQYDHVYQHHQTDLEFLLQRARRINYEILCDNTNLIFRQRKLEEQGEAITLKWGKDASGAEFSLQRFNARLNTASQVTEVQVRCWDPSQSKEIIGSAKALVKKLGATDGGSLATKFGGTPLASYEVPVDSKEEADAIAKALLEDMALNYITGEGVCKGHQKIKAGAIVTIQAQDKRFDGKYYLTGVSHRYTHKGGSDGGGGYLTHIKFRRNAEGT